MSAAFDAFLERHCDEIVYNPDGSLCSEMFPVTSPASSLIMADLAAKGVTDLPTEGHPHDRLGRWVLNATDAQKAEAGLAIEIPPGEVHFVPGKYQIFYDFKNTDIVLDELVAAGADMNGSLLDFGCSSGRNLATLQRAYGTSLELTGADPAEPSVAWLNARIPGVSAIVSRQNPPLAFDDQRFDIIIAKSIWTHFSPVAARSWFAEMGRVLRRGGYFAFSTHGPHDVASRILLNIPSPRYDQYTGSEQWTRDAFLADLTANYDRAGYYFQAFKDVGHQGDLKLVEDARTADWGLMWMSPAYLQTLLPDDLHIIRRSVGRTGNRHDLYVVRKD